jgi:DNA-directed RNA polymerase subunit N (RpoN/RPB10)
MGPCMCGDTYCRSCGNPAAAAWEDFVLTVDEKFFEGLDLPEGYSEQVSERLSEFLEQNWEWLLAELQRHTQSA